MTHPKDDKDIAPESVIRLAYLHVFRRMRRWNLANSLALLAALVILGGVIMTIQDQRRDARANTQEQIRELACGVVAQIPPDEGLADFIRVRYGCGPYVPPNAVVQPKPGKG